MSFNTAIDACATSEKWQEAVKILEVDMACSKVITVVIAVVEIKNLSLKAGASLLTPTGGACVASLLVL